MNRVWSQHEKTDKKDERERTENEKGREEKSRCQTDRCVKRWVFGSLRAAVASDILSH